MSAVLLQKQQVGEMCSRIQNGVLCPSIYFRQISILKFMNSQMRMRPGCIALLHTAVPRYLLTGRLSGRITTFWLERWPMTEQTRRLQHIWQGCLEKSAQCVRTNNVCRCSCRKIWKIKSVCGHLPRWPAFLLRGAKK